MQELNNKVEFGFPLQRCLIWTGSGCDGRTGLGNKPIHFMQSCNTSPDIPLHAVLHFSLCTGPVQDFAAAAAAVQLFQASFQQNVYSTQDQRMVCLMPTGQAVWSRVKASMQQSSEISFLIKQGVSICWQMECVLSLLQWSFSTDLLLHSSSSSKMVLLK